MPADYIDTGHDREIIECRSAVLRLIATDAPLTEILGTMLEHVESLTPGMKGSVLLMDDDGKHLLHGAAPSLPADYLQAIGRVLIGPNVGSCGTAAYLREQVIAEDIASDPRWKGVRSLALAHGLHACWSTPILDQNGEVLGTFAMYFDEPALPDDWHRHIIELVTDLASIAISRQRREAAYHLSESRYRRLIESDIVGVLIANTDGGISEANDRFLKMVGYTRDDLEAGLLRWDTMTAPEWQATDEWMIEQLATSRTCPPTEKEYLRKDGTPVPILVAAAMLNGSTDSLCIVNDLTEQKRVTHALKASEASLARAQERVHLGSWELDLATLTGSWSAEHSRLLYYDPSLAPPDFEGFLKRVHPDDRERIVSMQNRVIRSGTVATYEYRTHPDLGPVRLLSSTVHPIQDEHGRVTGLAGTTLDVTEARKAEAALTASREHLTALVNSVDGIVWEVDAATFQFTFVSPRAERLLGYPLAEWTEKATFWVDHIHPDDREQAVNYCKQQTQQRRDHEFEYRMVAADGRPVWIHDIVTVVAEDGQPVKLRGIMTDITDRKISEQQLGASRDQLRALVTRLRKAREDERIRISREIHDELGQLLTGLKMEVCWLERKLSGPDIPPALNPLLDRAVSASELADATITTVQKIAAELRPGTLDQLGLASAIEQEARRFQQRSGTDCAVEIADSWEALPADMENELFYIAMEALTNVARHAQAHQVQISLRSEAGVAVLEVTDDGIGINPDVMTAPGSLGLLGMEERAAQCGGTLRVERIEPAGTKVTVRLNRRGGREDA